MLKENPLKIVPSNLSINVQASPSILKDLRHALDLSFEEWEDWCSVNRLPRYISGQIINWIYKQGNLNPDTFSNLSKQIRQLLVDSFLWSVMEVVSRLYSQDESEKFLLKTADNLLIEMVLMPSGKRTTLCISSQVGCRMGCTFCQTGKMGFKRNLGSGEILTQIHMANVYKKITNIVFMGMGEPLDNYDNVIKACKIMIAPKGYHLSTSKVTISTSGLVPEIYKLAQELPVRLAISLHQTDDIKRSKIMPINRKHNLQELKESLLKYPANSRYGITFEYVMIEGVNDSIADAKKLVRFVHGLKAKVNLIPLNHFPGVDLQASTKKNLREFQLYLSERSIAAPVRYSRGQDVSGGCGQLAAKKEEELHLSPREIQKKRQREII